MSDIPGGPGWWQASDGRLYPPELHPSQRAPGGPAFFGPPNMAGPEPSSRIEVGFGVPSRQNRWAIGFRWLLVVPHIIYLLVLSIAAVAVLVIAWFAALATGELPSSIRRWLTSYLRYYARLSGYILLLTDRYPPFRLTGSQYPIDIETPETRLPRLTVLFRVVLAIPATIVGNLLSVGLVVTIFFVWVIAL